MGYDISDHGGARGRRWVTGAYGIAQSLPLRSINAFLLRYTPLQKEYFKGGTSPKLVKYSIFGIHMVKPFNN